MIVYGTLELEGITMAGLLTVVLAAGKGHSHEIGIAESFVIV